LVLFFINKKLYIANASLNESLKVYKITAFSVTNVEFPSVTFCSPGSIEILTNATLIRMFYDFLNKSFNIKTQHSALEIAELLTSVRQWFSNQWSPPFEGRKISKKGRQSVIMRKMYHLFYQISLKYSILHIKGPEIFIVIVFGSPIKKFENSLGKVKTFFLNFLTF